jgi:quercetin dioxygenase-like cupin family protein
MLLSTALLLDWLGIRHDDERARRAAQAIEQGVADAVRSGVSTRDLGGTASTSEFTAAVVDRIEAVSTEVSASPSRPVVRRPRELAPLDRGGGVRTVHLVNGAIATQFLTGTTEFDPGASLPLHSHDCEESVAVLEGQAAFEADGEVIDLDVGDTTWLPAGVVHRFRNRGTGRLRILWIYGSARATRTIAATGETFPIGMAAERAEP